jgi:hypothetical protein
LSQKLRTSKIVLDNAREVEIGLRICNWRKFERLSKTRWLGIPPLFEEAAEDRGGGSSVGTGGIVPPSEKALEARGGGTRTGGWG